MPCHCAALKGTGFTHANSDVFFFLAGKKHIRSATFDLEGAFLQVLQALGPDKVLFSSQKF
jgi:hypothetical protein